MRRVFAVSTLILAQEAYVETHLHVNILQCHKFIHYCVNGQS